MKNLIIFALAAFLLLSCEKEEVRAESLKGAWELRHVLGIQVAGAPSHFEKGNGNVIEFSENGYKKTEKGKVIVEGTYTLAAESAKIDGTKFENSIDFDNGSYKVFVRISGNQLLISNGSIASDGVTSTYEKL